MPIFYALSQWDKPGLHIWRTKSEQSVLIPRFDLQTLKTDTNGFAVFPAELDHQIHEYTYFKLFCGDVWEKEEHNRQLPRFEEYRFPDQVWLVQDTNRVLTLNPFSDSHDEVCIHLITDKKYRGGSLYLWTPGVEGMIYPSEEEGDEHGLIFRIPLQGRNRHLFAFKFIDKDGQYEPDYANKLWYSHDGSEIWVHSQAAHVSSEKPVRKKLTVHFIPASRSTQSPKMHLWQTDSDFSKKVERIPGESGYVYSHKIYTGRPYGFKFFREMENSASNKWEHSHADREVILADDKSVWTLEGDHQLFTDEPVADRAIILEVVGRPPSCRLTEQLALDVWVNQAGELLYKNLAQNPDGTWTFNTYPEVVTSFRFHSAETFEAIERHTVKIRQESSEPTKRYVVLDRSDPLQDRPVSPLFQDPPSPIERPGVYERDGMLCFALHSPTASAVEITGEWEKESDHPVQMQSTRDGTYWWTRILVSDVVRSLDRNDYHKTWYKYRLNGVINRQDPAADWVENSGPESYSRLVNHDRYQWRSKDWQTPGPEYLIVYQLHPRRFSQRFPEKELSPLRLLAEEVSNPQGYLRQLGITAIQLMPVNEFTGDESWGYGPAFYYAVESAYCGDDEGPDDLKYFIDTCHEHGLAVLLDVVFNHAGTSDNILWSIARESFFDGDTSWGAMINFDHPQVIHFFEQNLLYLRREFRVDGFRFDHTHTIVHSSENGGHVTKAGSGGGWDFLHKLRSAVHGVDPHCLLVAEHLPNEWGLTRYGGPMDSQWCDSFHDRLVDAARGDHVISKLAAALKITHTSCNQWYETTNYPESHDEVGNVNDRIANVGGFGQGLRRNKVAAAVTILSRGIPLWFMGAESGESAQFFSNGSETLDLDNYMTDDARGRIRAWWKVLCDLRHGNPKIQGPAPLTVHFAENKILAFSRGKGMEFFVVLNFGYWSGWRPLTELNFPHGRYKELWNSTWPAFAVESEDEQSNGGRDARLQQRDWLQIPDYGVVILERV